MNEWPACCNCRSDDDGECGYRPSRPWTKSEPADIETYGCCGYWHGTNGDTLRRRCRVVISEVEHTRPPIDFSPPERTTA